MKFVFTQDEMAWADFALTIWANAATTQKDYRQAKLAARTRYKFAPNSSYVDLSGKEQELLKRVSAIAAAQVKPGSPEGPVVTSVLKKLEGVANDSNQADTREPQANDVRNA
jgi:hypothetical protein